MWWPDMCFPAPLYTTTGLPLIWPNNYWTNSDNLVTFVSFITFRHISECDLFGAKIQLLPGSASLLVSIYMVYMSSLSPADFTLILTFILATKQSITDGLRSDWFGSGTKVFFFFFFSIDTATNLYPLRATVRILNHAHQFPFRRCTAER